MRLSDFGAEDSGASLFGLGEEMDYSQGLPTPMSDLGTEDPANYFLSGMLFSAAVQGGIAYLLMSSSGKLKNPWKTLGYIGGGLMTVGAVGAVAAALAGKAFVDEAIKTNKAT